MTRRPGASDPTPEKRPHATPCRWLFSFDGHLPDKNFSVRNALENNLKP